MEEEKKQNTENNIQNTEVKEIIKSAEEIFAILKKLKEKFKGKILETTITKDNKPNILIAREDLIFIVEYLKNEEQFNFLDCISGVDLKDKLQVVYHLFSIEKKEWLVVKTNVNYENPQVESLVSLFETANWQEREIYDLFGIRFLFHPDLRRILLPDDWTDYPLRKNYIKQTKNLCYREELKPHLGGVKSIVLPQSESQKTEDSTQQPTANNLPTSSSTGEN